MKKIDLEKRFVHHRPEPISKAPTKRVKSTDKKIRPRYQKAFIENIQNDLDEFDFKTAVFIHVNDNNRVTVRELGGIKSSKFLITSVLDWIEENNA